MMAPKRSSMRYAHSDGHTDLCFDDSGRYMLTGGTDGDVRIWEGIEDDDAISHKVGDKVYAIAFRPGASMQFITANEMNSVQAHKFPNGDSEGLLARFTAPVTHLSMNKAGTTLIAGAADFTIKVINTEECTFKVLQGHEAPILATALDPKEEFVASSSCDGTVRVWNIGTQTTVKTWTLLQKCSDVSLSKTLCRLCWEPVMGGHLCVPIDKEVIFYERATWDKTCTLSHSSIKQPISHVAFSPCGKYFLTACVDGLVLIWSWPHKLFINSIQHERNLCITAIAWNPKGNNEIAFCDSEGQLGTIEEVLSDSGEKKAVVVSETPQSLQDIFDDSDDDLLVSSTAEVGEQSKDKAATVPCQDGSDDDSDDDFTLAMRKRGVLDDDASNDGIKSDDEDVLPPPAPVVPVQTGPKLTPLQRPFQPSSTPIHLSNRFMKWNSVGIIRQYNADDNTSIEVEFHDTAVHHAMHFSNQAGYTMADLSTDAIILASEGDSEKQSELLCMHFASWDSAKEWTVKMPEEEEIRAITIGDSWIAVATDRRNLRLFSLAGVQKEMFSMNGPVVCLCGHGSHLMIIYHRGMGVPGDQCLGLTLLSVEGKKRSLISGDSLPISPLATLDWAGFSIEGTPFCADSLGIVRMLNRRLGNTWTQVANTNSQAKSKSDHHWLVGVMENPQQLRCIACKSARYPVTLPRPALAILPFEMQLCEMETEKSQYEETFWRTRAFSTHVGFLSAQGYDIDPDSEADLMKPAQEALMKLFALSVRSNREFRALEICELMPDEHTLQLAIKYATRLRHIQLATRIGDIARKRAEQVIEEAEPDEDFTSSMNMHQNTAEAEWSQTNGYHGNRLSDLNRDDVTMDVSDDEEEEETQKGPMLNITPQAPAGETKQTVTPATGRSNPFRVSSASQQAPVNIKGSQIFDGLNKSAKVVKPDSPVVLKNQPIKKVPKKGPSQMKLFPGMKTSKETPSSDETTSKTPTAYELWLVNAEADLRSEHPDKSDGEIQTLATEKFRDLPKTEKQEWLKKAREGKSAAVDSDQENRKRKRDENSELTTEVDESGDNVKTDPMNKPKKATLTEVNSATKSKLSNFMFAKNESSSG